MPIPSDEIRSSLHAVSPILVDAPERKPMSM
ncbi:hypothetical protein BSFP_065400 [Burkholderia stabilis]|uniref:Uncharacterized protein n=1 Tax=Burkholderia stabilis TaxID=95485 RepID=A0A1Y1C0X0_9BURK|nr:hypothetical protein BSFP_065400 [Burkholderia stabilis]